MPHSRRPAANRTAAADTSLGQIIALLADGKPRDVQAILDEGRKQGLFNAATTKHSVYMNLLRYIQQETAKGRKPGVVEDSISRKFRVNHPVDDWPAVTLPPHPRYIEAAALEAISTRLRSTVTGADSTAFEKAVCDAFALFGFVAQYLGGLYAPDGILDAPLGPSRTARSSSARARRTRSSSKSRGPLKSPSSARRPTPTSPSSSAR